MSKGKYTSKRSRSSKSLVLVLALVMLITATVGGTLAWLGDKTETVTNTFSASGIDITLLEHEYLADSNTLNEEKDPRPEGNTNYNMVPGWTIPKDPTVTVLEGSEPCYLFVEVKEENDFEKFMSYKIDIGEDPQTKWVQGNDENGVPTDVYYRVVDARKADQEFEILAAGKKTFGGVEYEWDEDYLLVNPDLESEDMPAENDPKPTISFTAYAVQLQKTAADKFSPADAWKLAENMNPYPSTPDLDQGGSTD